MYVNVREYFHDDVSWYTLTLDTSQSVVMMSDDEYIGIRSNLQASLNEAPLAATNAAHVEKPVSCAQLTSCPGTPVPFQTAPAQSPLHTNLYHQYIQVVRTNKHINIPKSGIEDGRMGIEELVWIAIRGGKVGHRSRPFRRLRCPRGDI